jgi:hypothetical protein
MMYDRNNDIECSGIKIKDADLPKVQRVMREFPSVRFLYNPIKWMRAPYYEIAYGGKSADIKGFEAAIEPYYWYPPKPKRTFWQKIFGSNFDRISQGPDWYTKEEDEA